MKVDNANEEDRTEMTPAPVIKLVNRQQGTPAVSSAKNLDVRCRKGRQGPRETLPRVVSDPDLSLAKSMHEINRIRSNSTDPEISNAPREQSGWRRQAHSPRNLGPLMCKGSNSQKGGARRRTSVQLDYRSCGR